ncbi:MAG: NUMOD3 domain-containing DNA-binding protein, partial [Sediminibacterium sp.]
DPEYYSQWLEKQRKNMAIAKQFAPKNTFLGKKHSDETKVKMSDQGKKRIGANNSQYGTMWITNGVINLKINKLESIPENFYKGRTVS